LKVTATANGSFIDIYYTLMETLKEIDVQLDAAGDQKAAGKRKITNDLVEEFKDVWEPVVANLSKQLEAFEPNKRAGVYNGFVRALTKAFADETSAYVETLVPAEAEQTETVSPETLASLQKTRSELYAQVKAIVNIAKQLDGTELEMPARRYGGVGKRGKRALSNYTFTVDGAEFKNLSEVAKSNGYEKAAELTKALRDAKIDTTNPPKDFQFTLPNGKTLSAHDNRSDEERAADAVEAAANPEPDDVPDEDDENGDD
jgi:hypothetical protein